MPLDYYSAGPSGPQGPQGVPGPVGDGLRILDAHETYAEFIAEHPTGNDGDIHIVDGTLYVWNGELEEWVDSGVIEGPTTYGDISEDVLPSVDATHSIGSTALGWAEVHAGQVTLYSGTPELSAGSLSYDGRLFYGTPLGNQVGIVSPRQTYYSRTDFALANNSDKQSVLGLTNGVSVSAGTRYAYTLRFRVRATANSVNLFYALEGTCTFFSHQYTFDVGRATYAGAFSPVTKGYITGEADNQVRSATHISYGEVGGTYWKVQINGTVDVNAAGYLKPVVLFSPIPGTAESQDGAYMEIYPIGPSNAGTTLVGTWS